MYLRFLIGFALGYLTGFVFLHGFVVVGIIGVMGVIAYLAEGFFNEKEAHR